MNKQRKVLVTDYPWESLKPGREMEVLTGLASGGCQLILFTTGVGAPQRFPLCPVIKISGNKNTCLHLKEHIDVDVSTVIRDEESIAEGGGRIFKEIIKVASGKKVKAELLDYDANGVDTDIYVKGPVI
ncbi:MAG: UxaA family hydrolase [Candidatus Aerophobetes bacterium]|nr:UxaA family hydrolase [Candidatus Aerophobetes bacterium]